ncbi:MAG: P-type DNA transfer ATPase VirB11 [Rickettsiales bacterium]|nr:P-type DNA transfer ATPase VirB11 [Rickettsiales bacterium]
MSVTALQTYLAPIQALFERDGVTEISINSPHEAWVEQRGEMRREEIPEFNLEHLKSLSRLIAQSTDQHISEESPLLSATLPNGERIQIVFPPAVEVGNVAMSIRKPSTLDLDLDQYESFGAFQSTEVGKLENTDDVKLRQLLDEGNVKEFIKQSVALKKNIIVSGGTSTGKTTFVNAALKEIPSSERIITVEDAREVKIDHIVNRVHLLSSKGGQGLAKVETQDLIEACLRLRPDRIIVGELRGAEAFSFLRAVNTGHPGSISTLHADTPSLALEQLILMVMQAGLGITRDQIKNYVENVINVIIQLKRGDRGRRYVSEVYFKGEGE